MKQPRDHGSPRSLGLILLGLGGLIAGAQCSGRDVSDDRRQEARPRDPAQSAEVVTSLMVTPPTAPPPAMPTDSSVGPRSSLVMQDVAAAQVHPGASYVGVRVTGDLEIGPDLPPTSFSECRIEGSIVTNSPVNLNSCIVTGGVYAYDTGGTISGSLLLGSGQAFRPGTTDPADAFTLSTPWTVSDTIMRIEQGIPPAHVEASQVLGGVGITFRNVVFDTGGPFNNTQTADLNFTGKDLRCEDCWFIGYGGYALYSSGPGNVFVRPRFGRNSAFGLIYPNERGDPAPTVIDPMYIDGTPIT